MPKKKQPTHHRPVDDAVKHDISSAVEQIPHLLYHSFQEKETAVHQPDKPVSRIKTYQQRTSSQQSAKKTLLMIGVACITLIILVMWGWNMRVFWYHTQEITKDEPPIWEDAKKDLSSVIDKAVEQRKSIDELAKKLNREEKKPNEQAVADAMTTLIIASATTTATTTNQ